MSINEVQQTYQRPWGSYTTVAMDSGYQVKTISVHPGQQLSLQKHFKRSEHWVVVKGVATIQIDEVRKDYQVNEAVYIPVEAKHRLANFTEEEVVIVEVQVGSYLGEDDIVRFEDDYKRQE